MAKVSEIKREDISKRAQKIIKSLGPSASTEDKTNAALALSVLSLLSPETEPSISQQFLKFIKDIQK